MLSFFYHYPTIIIKQAFTARTEKILPLLRLDYKPKGNRIRTHKKISYTHSGA